MTSESEPVCEDDSTPYAGGKTDQQAGCSNVDVPPSPGSPQSPPAESRYHITCKPEKDWWDKAKPVVEIAGILLLAVYTFYTIKMYLANKEAADAAQQGATAANNAARIAGNSLLLSQASFQVEQRPYVVTDIPEFVVAPTALVKLAPTLPLRISVKLQPSN